jgi:hypothetical protein
MISSRYPYRPVTVPLPFLGLTKHRYLTVTLPLPYRYLTVTLPLRTVTDRYGPYGSYGPLLTVTDRNGPLLTVTDRNGPLRTVTHRYSP